MKIVSLQQILEALEDDAKSSRGCGIALLLFLAFILVTSAAAFSVYAIFPVLIFGGLGLLFLRHSKKQRQQVAKRSFYITTDSCQSKKEDLDIENGDSYILHFSDSLTRTIAPEDLALMGMAPNADKELYDATELGDAFYLVFLEGSKQPNIILSRKLCQLDMTGFWEENGRLIPYKPQKENTL